MSLERALRNVALPAVVHRVANDISASTRLIIIGDVHGCFDELQLLLRACQFSSTNDRLVFVGDLVNKGPKSLDVVRFVRESNSLCVRGNHEDAALSAYYQWVRNGRIANSAQYSYVEHFEPQDVKFLEHLPFSLTFPNHANSIVVHAGVVPGIELKDQRPVDLYKMRFVERETKEWKALEKIKFQREREAVLWAKAWNGPRHVFFGHAASVGLQEERFATGLDTGCCYGKKLTACIVPSNTLVHVDAIKQYEVPRGD
ncbi:hypothetical protein CCR75_009383 [Bremia lactucae]|uniref:Calcineurin-like phosphoesterase domain-containing protein n=1 Tax=Bremia lactucae TaxID=4779 RepID=A0A976FI51_BRELC|nr:hypothetical protein CCR75_009383 [Bremia lactucae]